MNLPTFKIRNSDGEPSDHEAVHVVYVRELQREHARYKAALERIANADYRGNRDPLSCIAHEALANDQDKPQVGARRTHE